MLLLTRDLCVSICRVYKGTAQLWALLLIVTVLVWSATQLLVIGTSKCQHQ